MCSVCYGIGNCPVCEPPDEDYYDEYQDHLADEADKYNDGQKLNEMDSEQ